MSNPPIVHKLMRINKREIPVTGDFFLPENWQLNYATSDVNDDFVMVRMMNLGQRFKSSRSDSNWWTNPADV